MRFLLEPLELGSEMFALADATAIGITCTKGYECDTGKVTT
jgi:hypothetical protein